MEIIIFDVKNYLLLHKKEATKEDWQLHIS